MTTSKMNDAPTAKILDKLSKLKAMAEGEAKIGNSAAAEAFAGMVNALLLRHELSAEDIPMPGQPEEPILEMPFDRDAYGVKHVNTRVGWQEALAHVVAPAHLCKFLVTPGSNRITFVGTKSNTTVCEYAYGVLASAADRMSIEARNIYWKMYRNDIGFEAGNYRASWLVGFIVRIGERLEEAKQREVAATGDVTTALVRLEGALVRVKSCVDEKYKKAHGSTRLRMGIRRGAEDGRKAADGVQLNKGIDTKEQKELR